MKKPSQKTARTAPPARPASPPKKRDFSFHWFFLVFWLTVLSTILISWQMIWRP